MADKMHQNEQERHEKVLDSMMKFIPKLSHRNLWSTKVVFVTKPDIDPASWAYECPRLGANIIQQSEPEGLVRWREYEPNGRDCASVVLHYAAIMNNSKTRDVLKGGNQMWYFHVVIYDPEKFLRSFEENGVESSVEQYFHLLATLWSETHKIRFRHKEWQIDALVENIEIVNYPKANK